MQGIQLKKKLDALRDKDNRKIPKDVIAKRSNIPLRTLYSLFDMESVQKDYLSKVEAAIAELTQNVPQILPFKSEGQLLKSAIDKQDKSISDIVKESGIPRPTLYTLFEKNIVDVYYLDKLKAIGIEIPEILHGQPAKPIPYYNVDVLAGKIDILREQSVEYVKEYYTIPDIKDATAIIRVSGDSMYPTFKRGDKVIIKYVKDKTLIEYGQTYVIVTQDNTVLKSIRKSKKDGYWLLCSENKAKFDDYEIPIDKVINLFLVKEIMRAENL